MTEVSGDAEADIRTLIEARVGAMQAKDAARIADSLAAAIIAFEMVPPLSLPPGAAADVGGIRKWLEGWQGQIGVEVRDLTIHAARDVAFCHSLNRLSGTTTDGRKVGIWMRSTFGLRRIGGDWKIVHSHTSVPIRPDGQAALDLTP